MDKKKIGLHIFIIVILCIPVFFIFYAIINANNSPSYKTETVTDTEPRVYITTYGERYHSSNCSYLSQSKIPIGKYEAISKGYSACSRCGGRSNGTITVKYKKQVEVDGTTKNVWGAIGLSVLCTPLLYLFVYVLVKNHIEDKRLYSTPKNKSIPTTKPAATPPPPPPTPSVKIRVGDAVNHKLFGLGIIKKFDGKYFTVQFDHDSKDFVYPDVFDSGIMEDFNSQTRN